MDRERVHFLICEYLDGELSGDDLVVLQGVLESESWARDLLESEKQLTASLRALPGPDVDWSELAGDLSAVVTGNVRESNREADQKLNALFKAARIGPHIRWEALAQHISASIDRELAVTDASDDKLDAMLRAAPIPQVNWDALANQISGAIARQEEAVPAHEEQRPQVILKISWARRISAVALAACLAIAGWVGIRMYQNEPGDDGKGGIVRPVTTAKVEGPQVELAAGPAVADISIGPSSSYAAADEEYNRGGVARGPVVIALPAAPAEDSGSAFGFSFE